MDLASIGQMASRIAKRATRAMTLATIALVVSACGSGNDKPEFHRFVVFGDSISDMGTYQVGAIAAAGGGRYTVNPGPVWSERVAQRLNYPITSGIKGFDGVFQVCPVPPNCSNWAQGGGRVTLHPGIRENADGTGQLAKTISEQIAFHLARFGGSFAATDLISVQAGGNDAFFQLGVLTATLQGGGNLQQASAAAVGAMATAGAELAGYVKNDILGKGARFVIVSTFPDLAGTPFGVRLGAQNQALLGAMADAFNAALVAGLAGTDARMLDIRAQFATWLAAPAAYGISNATSEACSRDKIAAATGGLILDGASLFCSAATLVDGDTSRYFFADDVHPAPYGHELIANAFIAELVRLNWR
ncbi:MAG: SGNH/GDSL hydrolase family protein [Burkholderiaceae bacterium]|nr:SGNH/GDSL hydrolase family protein [Burkholderiaceae bacterium]